jgi:hypothetical protein
MMNSHKSQLCCGNSISTGKPCKNYVVTGDFCRHHQDQISGKNKYGVPINQKNAESQPCKKSKIFCRHHKVEITDKRSDNDNQNVTQQCDGITKKGTRCKNKFKYQGKQVKFCHKSAQELNNDLFIPGIAKRNYYSING